MDKKCICDDRGVLENIRKIREMTDEEFEKHIEELKEQNQKEKIKKER